MRRYRSTFRSSTDCVRLPRPKFLAKRSAASIVIVYNLCRNIIHLAFLFQVYLRMVALDTFVYNKLWTVFKMRRLARVVCSCSPQAAPRQVNLSQMDVKKRRCATTQCKIYFHVVFFEIYHSSKFIIIPVHVKCEFKCEHTATNAKVSHVGTASNR